MQNLVIEGRNEIPSVFFDATTGVLEISGSSYPEDTSEFYKPITEWITEYMLNITGNITMNFRLDYLNSSSIKFISDIIDKLIIYSSSGAGVVINWYYQEDDDDILEMGEDLKQECDLPFNLIKES